MVLDQILQISANAAITIGVIRSAVMAARRIVSDHIGQLAKLTKATDTLATAVNKLEQRVTMLEQLVQKGSVP